MCRPVVCKTCQKATWAGCGKHVADVRAMFTAEEWCPGHEPAAASVPWYRRLLGGPR